MQLQELKMLVEHDVVLSLIAIKRKGGWVLTVTKKKSVKGGGSGENALFLARGGMRFFKTLDALAKLVKDDLYSSPFTVC